MWAKLNVNPAGRGDVNKRLFTEKTFVQHAVTPYAQQVLSLCIVTILTMMCIACTFASTEAEIPSSTLGGAARQAQAIRK